MEENERMILSKWEADALLEEGEMVHTLKQVGPVLVGCDMCRNTLLDMAMKNGAELSGEQAKSMNHGVVIWDRKEPIFCATK
jgi:hypothetical protein